MTDNVRREGLGFCAEGKVSEMGKALEQSFTPEFLGRLDSVVHFEALEEKTLVAIACKYLQQLQQRTKTLGIELQIPVELAQMLGGQCRGKGGARQLRRMVQTQVEGPLASYLLRCARNPGKIKLKTEGNQVVFL